MTPRIITFVITGVTLVLLATYIGSRLELGPKLDLDLRGERTTGTVERKANDTYRIRYTLDDRIYAASYTGGFATQPPEGETFEIEVAYDPDNPEHVQPAGISYKPGAAIGLLFLAGLTCILHARHTVRRTRTANPE